MLRNMFDGMGMGMVPQRFNVQLACFTAPFYTGYSQDKVNELNNSGKILLPPSALDQLVRMHIEYPMMFAITSATTQAYTHVGVLEFVADEGRCYVPAWVLRQLGHTDEGRPVTLTYKALPQATFAKFKPMSVDFLDITDPRAVLEVKLRNFSCLTKGDQFAFDYNNRSYSVLVQEMRPADAVSIVECDMNVEFDAPEGYVEPAHPSRPPAALAPVPQDPHTVPMPPEVKSPDEAQSSSFVGQGRRLDDKKPKRARTTSSATLNDKAAAVDATAETTVGDGLPDFAYTPGTLDFPRGYIRPERLKTMRAEAEAKAAEAAATTSSARSVGAASSSSTAFVPFSGTGRSLRS